MATHASKHSVNDAILLSISYWHQRTLTTQLQHLFHMTAVFAEAQLGSVTGAFHCGVARGDRDPTNRLLHGFLEIRDGLGSVLINFRLQMAPKEEVGWG